MLVHRMLAPWMLTWSTQLLRSLRSKILQVLFPTSLPGKYSILHRPEEVPVIDRRFKDVPADEKISGEECFGAGSPAARHTIGIVPCLQYEPKLLMLYRPSPVSPADWQGPAARCCRLKVHAPPVVPPVAAWGQRPASSKWSCNGWAGAAC